MRQDILCKSCRIFYFVLIGFLIFPDFVFADHDLIHSNTQAIEGLNEFLTGPDLKTIIMIFAFISGFSVGAR